MTHLGIDLSQWGGDLAPATVDCWKALGVKYGIAQYSHRMTQHIDTLLAGGVHAEAYVYLYFPRSEWGQTPEERVEACLGMLGDRPVSRVWLDVEDTQTPNDTPEGVVASLQRCVALLQRAGKQTGIYTGRWVWPRLTGNSDAFAHLPLWHAEYRGTIHVPPDFDSFSPYGGWNRPLIWQFMGTTALCGHSVDLNDSETAFWEEQPPVPEPVDPDQIALAILRTNNEVILSLAMGTNHCVASPDGRIEWKYVDETGAGQSYNPPIFLPIGAPQ